MGYFQRKFEPFYQETSQDIYAFCRAIGFTPTWQQRLLFDAVMKGYQRIAVKSGQGPGKTAASSVVGLWRSWRRFNALTIVTAPTMRQCREVWLGEVRRRLENAHPYVRQFINATKSKVEIGGFDDWGVKLITATKEENAQGFHQDNLTIIAEEASGISREIITQFKGTSTNKDRLFLMIGNPNTRDCAFFDCFNSQRSEWYTLTFNAEESPVVDKANLKSLEREFGRDSDVYRIRVLGEFPYSDPNCVISSEILEHCTGDDQIMYRLILRDRGEKYAPGRARQFGIDLARFGGDESTIYRRSGNAIVEWKHFAHTDPADVIECAFRMQADAGWTDKETYYVADATGMGQGLMHKFHRAGKNILEFHNGGSAMDSTYANRITEAWFEFAKRAKARQAYIPNDNQLIQQLCGRQYYTNKKGRLILETKDEYMKRGNGSPDRADGLVMAFYDPIMAEAQSTQTLKGQNVGVQTAVA